MLDRRQALIDSIRGRVQSIKIAQGEAYYQQPQENEGLLSNLLVPMALLAGGGLLARGVKGLASKGVGVAKNLLAKETPSATQAISPPRMGISRVVEKPKMVFRKGTPMAKEVFPSTVIPAPFSGGKPINLSQSVRPAVHTARPIVASKIPHPSSQQPVGQPVQDFLQGTIPQAYQQQAQTIRMPSPVQTSYTSTPPRGVQVTQPAVGTPPPRTVPSNMQPTTPAQLQRQTGGSQKLEIRASADPAMLLKQARFEVAKSLASRAGGAIKGLFTPKASVLPGATKFIPKAPTAGQALGELPVVQGKLISPPPQVATNAGDAARQFMQSNVPSNPFQPMPREAQEAARQFMKKKAPAPAPQSTNAARLFAEQRQKWLAQRGQQAELPVVKGQLVEPSRVTPSVGNKNYSQEALAQTQAAPVKQAPQGYFAPQEFSTKATRSVGVPQTVSPTGMVNPPTKVIPTPVSKPQAQNQQAFRSLQARGKNPWDEGLANESVAFDAELKRRAQAAAALPRPETYWGGSVSAMTPLDKQRILSSPQYQEGSIRKSLIEHILKKTSSIKALVPGASVNSAGVQTAKAMTVKAPAIPSVKVAPPPKPPTQPIPPPQVVPVGAPPGQLRTATGSQAPGLGVPKSAAYYGGGFGHLNSTDITLSSRPIPDELQMEREPNRLSARSMPRVYIAEPEVPEDRNQRQKDFPLPSRLDFLNTQLASLFTSSPGVQQTGEQSAETAQQTDIAQEPGESMSPVEQFSSMQRAQEGTQASGVV